VNLPRFGPTAEAAKPHQQGGSESLGFRRGGFPFRRILGLILRTNPARLCRMGTRLRQLARGRFHALSSGTRRYPSAVHFRVVRVTLRRVRSVVHFHAFRIRPRRIDSFQRDRRFMSGFRRIRSVVHGALPLLSCFRKSRAACRGKGFHTRHELRRRAHLEPKLSEDLPVSSRSFHQAHPLRAETLCEFAGGIVCVALSGSDSKSRDDSILSPSKVLLNPCPNYAHRSVCFMCGAAFHRPPASCSDRAALANRLISASRCITSSAVRLQSYVLSKRVTFITGWSAVLAIFRSRAGQPHAA
jgi:hypothetical protein